MQPRSSSRARGGRRIGPSTGSRNFTEDALVRSRLSCRSVAASCGITVSARSMRSSNQLLRPPRARRPRGRAGDSPGSRGRGIGNRLGRRRDAVGTRLPARPDGGRARPRRRRAWPGLADGEGNEKTRRFLHPPRGNAPSMPRAIWTGAISVGLVNLPVRLYSAIDGHRPRVPRCSTPRTTRRIGYREGLQEGGQAGPGRRDRQGRTRSRRASTSTSRTRTSRRPRSRGTAPSTIERLRPVRGHRPDLLRADVLPRAAGGRRAACTPCCVRAMEEAGLAAIATYVMREKQAPRLPPPAGGSDHAREDVLRG